MNGNLPRESALNRDFSRTGFHLIKS